MMKAPVPVFRGKVDKGALVILSLERFNAWVKSLDGKEVEITVRKKRTKRSDQQNRYYWGVIIKLLCDDTGYEPEEMHDSLKAKFLGASEEDEFGLVKIPSTTKLTIDEFVEYTNGVIRWAAEFLKIYIPSPNECDY